MGNNVTLKDLVAGNHEYYCYTTSEDTYYYDTFDDFFEEMGKVDLDYNLLFRWDVLPREDEDGDAIPGKYTLNMYYVQQRKGRMVCNTVRRFVKEDVDKLIPLLQKHFVYLVKLWKPILP